ncbi:uncharacterized protein LOC112455963 [Temnothorax curvispinosus]|uniref:Uncharacterized protein LOC112455963 n=1 Tax=Temnothorax curvispinosus TaxID=300111 RepID=A0A6J1PYZ0_9HYME|nr:uncharacterized protein LOC112455963 [Temnothorax curvispinosus]
MQGWTQTTCLSVRQLRIKKEERKKKRLTNADDVKSTEGTWRIRWDKETIRRYKEKTNKNIFVETQQEETIEEKWTNLKKMVHEAMVKKRVNTTRREMVHKDWWDKECTRKKRSVKRLYKKWRVEKLDRGRYLEERRNLKTLLEQKRKEKRAMEEELKNIKNGAEELLEYTDKEKIQPNRKGISEEREEGEQPKLQLNEEEIEKAIKRMKRNKATGIDGIPMEAWMYGGGSVKRKLVDLLKHIWREGELPEDWKTSIIVPLHKRGDEEKVENYRGISLLCSAYKIYAEVLRCRLKREVDLKDLLPESQAGFRGGWATADNIFVLDHLVQRVDKEGKKDKLYALFVDLKRHLTRWKESNCGRS